MPSPYDRNDNVMRTESSATLHTAERINLITGDFSHQQNVITTENVELQPELEFDN
jgi:hypothetical protein